MHLILSSSSPWNANYCNEVGQVLYRAGAPGWFPLDHNIKLSRVVPPSLAACNEYLDDPSVDHNRVEEAALRDVFEPVGEVEYHVFKNSRIKYQGRDQSVNDFFGKMGLGPYGSHRVFLGPLGREYVWKMNPQVCKLFLNDASETPVATFHRKSWGV